MEKTAKQSFESSPLERPTSQNEPGIVRSTRKAGDPISPELRAEIERVKATRDNGIDFSDIPPTTPQFWRRAAQRKSLERVAQNAQPLIAKRHLLLLREETKVTVDVEIGPISDHVHDASCHVRISSLEGELRQDIFGIDGVQAVQLALRFAGSELDRIGGKNWQHQQEKGHGFDMLRDLEKAS